MIPKPHRAPSSFSPCVCGAEINEKLVLILVCGGSVKNDGHIPRDDGGIDSRVIYHPVAIRLGAPAHIYYGYEIRDHAWHVKTAEECGMSLIYAQRTLAEAWRGIEEISQPSYPQKIWHLRAKVNMIQSLSHCSSAQEKTMFRNVNAWLQWGGWDQRQLTSIQRARELSAMGIPATDKIINKIKENAELAEI